MRSFALSALAATMLLAAASPPAAAQLEDLPFDHIHLRVPDAAEAFLWYYENLGGTVIAEAPNRLRYGSTRLMFLQGEAAPSEGSALDHLGFSVADLDATVEQMRARGVNVTSEVREIPGLFPLAFIEDPWGTRIELVEDADHQGLHHIHLRSPDPAAALDFLEAHLGGERTQLEGLLDGLYYGGTGFSPVWILVQEGEATPSVEHSIDHVGWRVVELGHKVETLAEHGVNIETEPRYLPLPDNSALYYSYISGPAGARLELVQRYVEDRDAGR